MKKIIGIISMLTLFGQSQAMTNIPFDSTVEEVSFYDSKGDILTTGNGYLVSFWWSQTGEADSYSAIGLAGFLDASQWHEWSEPNEFDGMFFFSTKSIVPAIESAESHLMIRIFQTDVSGMSFGYDAEISKPDAIGDSASLAIADMWDAAFALWANGGEADIGEWDAVVTTFPDGGISGYITDWFGWAANGQVFLSPTSYVPEPAEIALAFGFLVFAAACAGKKRSKYKAY